MELSSLFKKIKILDPIPTGVSFQTNLKKDHSFKAVIFDIYGTLLISNSGDIGAQTHYNMIEALKESCITWEPEIKESSLQIQIQNTYIQTILDDHISKKAQGIDFPEIIIESIWKKVLDKIQPQFNLKIPPSFNFRKFSLRYEFLSNCVYPFPKLKSTLEQLSNMGLKLGLVSNAQFFTPMLMHYFLGSQDFIQEKNLPYFENDLCFYSYKEGIAKPSINLYKKLALILSKQNIQPEKVLYIGNDMLNDIYGANQVNFKTALFAGDKRSLRWRKNDPRSKGLQPEFIINNLDQILICLGNRYAKK